MPKLYQHVDKFVEAEFLNAYRQVGKISAGGVGPTGPRGPQGLQGPQGQAAVQTLYKVVTNSGVVGTINDPFILFDFWACVYTWSGANSSSNFKLKYGTTDLISTNIDFSSVTAPCQLWPTSGVYTSPLVGKLFTTGQTFNFTTVSAGTFIIVINYLPVTLP